MAESTSAFLKPDYTVESGKPVSVYLSGAVQKVLNDIAESARKSSSNSDESLQNEENNYIASERKNRARANAVYGKVDKVFSATETLKKAMLDALKALGDIVKDGLKKSLRSYDEMTKGMRQSYLTSEQIAEAGLKADQSRLYLSDKFGVEVNSGELKKTMTSLVGLGYSQREISKEVLSATSLLSKFTGVSVEDAFRAAITSGDVESLIKTAINSSDRVGNAATAELFSKISEPFFRDFADKVGGTEKALALFNESSKRLDVLSRGLLSPKATASLLTEAFTLSSGRLEDSQESELINILSIRPDDISDPEKVLSAFERMITEKVSNEEFNRKMRVLESAGVSKEVTTTLKDVRESIAKGNKGDLKTIKTFEQNIESINQAQEGGRLGGGLDKLTAWINANTAGSLSKLSAYTNELFGESLTMETIVSNGFNLVSRLLIGILASKVISGGYEVLKTIGTAATATGGVGAAGASAAGAGASAAGAGKAGKALKYVKRAGFITLGAGIAALVGGYIFNRASSEDGSSNSNNEEYSSESVVEKDNQKRIQQDTYKILKENRKLTGDFYTDILNAVIDIRDSLAYAGNILKEDISERFGEPLNKIATDENINELDIAQSVASLARTPLDKFGIKSGEKLGARGRAALENTLLARIKGISPDVRKSVYYTPTTTNDVLNKINAYNAKKEAEAAEKLASSNKPMKAVRLPKVGKIVGAAGAVIDIGISGVRSGLNAAEGVRQADIGAELSRELFKKEIMLEKAKKAGDQALVARIAAEIADLDKSINESFINSEKANDQAWVEAIAGAASIVGGVYGGKLGAVLGTLVLPGVGTMAGGMAGQAVGALAAEKGARALAEWGFSDSPEELAEKVKERRAKERERFERQQQFSLQQGLSEDLTDALLVTTESEDEFKKTVERLASHIKSGLSEEVVLAAENNNSENAEGVLKALTDSIRVGLSQQEQAYIAANATSADEVKDLRDSILASPEKIYSNVVNIMDTLIEIRDIIKPTFKRQDSDHDGSFGSAVKAVGKKIPIIGGLFDFFADGGIVNQATASVVGEDGKEAIIPLTKPHEMKNVLTRLTTNEKRQLLEALFSDKDSTMLTWDLLGNVLFNELGIGHTAATQKIKDKLYGIDDLPKEDTAVEQPKQTNEQLSKDPILEEQRRLLREATLAVLSKANGEVYNMIRAYAYDALKNIDLASSKEMSEYLGYIVNYLRDIASYNKRMNNTISPMRPAAKQFK